MTRMLAMLVLLVGCDTPPRNGAPPPGPPPSPPPEAPAPPPPPASAPKSDYDPCVGRPCGSPCNICPPDDADCVETAVVKTCDAQGKCTPEAVNCPAR